MIFDINITPKKWPNRKNNTTFSNKTFLGSVTKVTLFLRFYDILMVKIECEKAELWGYGDQWVLDQMTWDQNFFAPFDDI